MKTYFGILCLFCLLQFGCTPSNIQTEYVAFYDVQYDEKTSSFVYLKENNGYWTNEKRPALVAALVYYGVGVRVVSDSIFEIQAKDTMDLELLWNIQLKAEDKAWFIDHILEFDK